jgi:micrococcal nuclease
MVLDFIIALLISIHGFFTPTATHLVDTPQTEPVWVQATGTVTRVVDGDTIEVEVSDGHMVRVRYIGIDAPEKWPTVECGSANATARNQELVSGKTVTLVPGPGLYDTYGRRLAYVYVDAVFVNQTLLTEGWASVMMISPNTENRALFERIESLARSKRQGIWGCS